MRPDGAILDGMTEFRVEVVRVGELVKHPNADSLSITQVHGGYPVIVRTEDWKTGDLGVYVPVDAMVPTDHYLFSFLGKHNRIKAKRLRGVFSMGLLVPAPLGAKEGQDCAEFLGITQYQPPTDKEERIPGHAIHRKPKRNEYYRYELGVWALAGLASVTALCIGFWWMAPIFFGSAYYTILHNRKHNLKPNVPIYDIEGLRRHKDVFQPGELVSITEKIHGCNARYVHTGKRFHIGSRTQFRSDGVWAQAAKKYGLEEKLKTRPFICLFGEVYGPSCQDLHYGVKQGDVGFVAFDAMNVVTREYLSVAEFQKLCKDLNIPNAPVLYEGEWMPELTRLAEGTTVLPGGHVREGFVVKPFQEQKAHGLGRKLLKMVGEGYQLR